MVNVIFMNAKMLWKIVISVVIVGVSVGKLAQVEAVQCYSCTDCAEQIDPVSTKDCEESNCAVWKNSDSKIERGCKPDGVQADDLKHECSEGLCNDKTVLVCQTCSANVNDCEDLFCKIEDGGDPKCYISKADSDESRGCKSDLQPASDENDYAFCSTPNCNQVAICVECNSNDDPDCRQGNLDQKDDIKCPNNGVIYEYSCYREEGDDGSLVELGCTSKLSDPEKQESDYFKKCAGDSCNKKAILSCYKCEKCESIVEGETETERCGKYPTSCITYYESDPDTNELKVSRSCPDFQDLNNIEQAGYDFYELCDEEPLCNKKDSANHRKCYQCTDECDTLDDTKLDYCPDMEADFCYTLQRENGLIHGCDKDDKAGECKEFENCRKCSTEGCNPANPDQINCFKCEGADQCKDPGTGTEKCPFYEDKCFMRLEDGQLTKGCSTPELASSCSEENCELCSGSRCNGLHCVQCNSKTNADCITGKGKVGYELCTDAGDKCVAFVNDDGFTVRGCKSSFPDLTCETGCEFDEPGSNDDLIPEDALQCLHCNELACDLESSTAEYCQSNQNLGCFIKFNGQEITDRGCVTKEMQCDEDPNCYSCTGENCNYRDLCYECEDCDTIQISSNICITQQNRGCYSRQDLDDKKISRGCVDQQSDEECQEGFNCIVCEGTKCNKDEPMQHPLKCSKCDLGKCTDYAPADDCDSTGLLVDRCVKYARFGVIFYKGCLSSTPKEITNECLGPSDFCTLCINDYCNTDQLSCYQCSTRESSLECVLNPKEHFLCSPGDSCTTCLDTEGHLHRGCSSDLTCTQSEKCTSPDCNKEPFPTDRLECHQCQDCLETPESNIKPCLLYIDNDSCYIQVVDESTIHRGCTSDNIEPCGNCLECSDLNGCNSMGPMQSNTLSCVSCTSNADCEGRAFGSPCQAQILIGRTDSCYTQMFGEFVIAKGCLSDLPPSNPLYEDCMQSSSNCPTCSTPDCNKGKTSCFKCNSADDADCSEIASLKNYETECEAECVTKLDDEGYTVRGCIEDFPEFDKENCKSSDRCQVCTDKNCNNAILPENEVLRCFQCEGSDSACLEATMPSMMKACRKYVPGDGCYVLAENATWIVRGCLSDLTEEALCDGLCLDCNEDGCNDQPVLKQNSLVCVSCKGADCQGQKEGKRCTEKIILGREDSCYQYDDGQIVQKGCLSDLMLDEESEVKESCETWDEETCKLCNYDACNGEYHYCVSCDSSKDPECAGRIGTVSEALRKDCDVSRCVSRYKDNTTVIKGCASATEPCEKNDPYCSECEGNLCNNIPFPADRILCHQCSGCDDVTAVESAICSKYNPEESCFTRLIDGAIYRGCLSEATVECDEQCFTCNSNGCNNEPSHYDSELSCVHCQGGTQCKEATVDQSKKCQGSVALGETDECYTLKVGSEVLERGCVESKQSSCSGSNSCEETTCSCDNCNLADKDKELTCHKCEGKDCRNALSAPGETCKGIACVSYVSRDGIVSRGCLHDYKTMCSIYGNRNSLCFGDQCNGEIYPVGRMTCYQCEGCTSPEQSRICERYVENDGCYTLTDGTYVERGCLSDLPLGCSGSECVACSESDCNDKEMTTNGPPAVTTPGAGTTSDSGTTPEAGTTPGSGNTPGSGTSTLEPLTQSCIICSETASNEMCAWAFKPSLASTCPVSVNETDDVGCFGCLKDSRAIRGCTANLREDTCDTVPAINCSESGCNTASFRVQRCAICTTDCDGSKASYPVQNCTGNVEYEQRGCYVRRSVRLVVTERGCFADLSEKQQQDCLKDGDTCLRCTGDVCNGGARMEAFWAMIIGALAFVIIRVKFV